MIPESPPHILHQAHRRDIPDKQDYPEQPLENAPYRPVVKRRSRLRDKREQLSRQPYEQRDRKRHAEHRPERHSRAHQEVILFLFLLVLLFFRLFRHGNLGRAHQALIADLHRVDKIEYAADERRLVELVVMNGCREDFEDDFAVRVADSHCGALRTAHHYTLDERLPADGCVIWFFFWFFQLYASFLSVISGRRSRAGPRAFRPSRRSASGCRGR